MAAEELGLAMQGGFLQPLPPNATKEQQTAVLNDIISRLNDQLRAQVYSDGETKRLLIGYQENGWGQGEHFGIKVSMVGVDVTQATDDQLLFRMALANWQWRNSDGKLIKEFDIENGTEFYYDPESGKDYMQAGILPDGTGGTIVAKPGYSVEEDIYG